MALWGPTETKESSLGPNMLLSTHQHCRSGATITNYVYYFRLWLNAELLPT